ncbi:MAG: asparagine synthase (glutamine-hydrolyzing) [Pseudomonadota bacterium]
MCGLAGMLWQPDTRSVEDIAPPLAAMTDAIAHRGPDDQGQWHDLAAGVALGHRRLSIIDLSAAGHQPMTSPSGRFVMVYNGEVYNHLDLRAALEESGRAPRWQGTSDSETLVAGFDVWGLAGTVERTIGMFAIAVWDRETRRLTLIRDRLGEKPLYFGWQGSGRARTLLFGSELKALSAHPAFERRLDPQAVLEMLRHSAVGGARCIWQGIAKVLPGTMVTLSPDGEDASEAVYWSIDALASARARDSGPTMAAPEAVEALEALLSDAVGRQMMSDVPLGAFLSGGIDSSIITALMQRTAARPVKTFSIGFHSARYDEATHAKAVAAHLGTEHTELYVGERDLLDVVPTLPRIFDEPFADPSQIPTYLVAGLARRHVTVALSGDGGDELFGGYDRYRKGARMAGALARVPHRLRRLGARVVDTLPDGLLDAGIGLLRRPREGEERGAQWLRRMARYAGARDTDALHRLLVSFWDLPPPVVRGVASEAPNRLTESHPDLDGLSPAERMMALDAGAYMVDDILAKVDRATMAVSLESRAPLLDHRIAEFAWSLPLSLKIGDMAEGMSAKWVLRQVLYRHVPRALIDRPKQGFETPTGAWLRGPLSDWAEALIAPDRLHREGILDPAPIRAMWEAHRDGRGEYRLQLWNVLMFQAWAEAHLGRAADTPARAAA